MSHRPVRDAVLEALGQVLDPELDAPLTELGFIHALEVDGGAVRVTLRLPTYWCSANFAYLMGEDIIGAVGAVADVETVEVRLTDHFAARRVNRGLAEGKSFAEAFGAEAAGNLEALRADFRDKAFLSRQAAVIQVLRGECDPHVIVATTVADLRARARSAAPIHSRQIERYLDARLMHVPLDLDQIERQGHAPELESGAVSDRSIDPNRAESALGRGVCGELAFITLDGAPIEADGLIDYLREGRRVAGSMAANGELCRMLLDARYGPNAAASSGSGTAAAVDEQHHDDDDAVDHLAERFVHLHHR